MPFQDKIFYVCAVIVVVNTVPLKAGRKTLWGIEIFTSFNILHLPSKISVSLQYKIEICHKLLSYALGKSFPGSVCKLIRFMIKKNFIEVLYNYLMLSSLIRQNYKS